ncbi:MAG: hypothetical protein HND57_09945 [Planctomycetes bacterium]|nr:hypothetical protein [Planctomycetota bacterium]
MPMRSAESRRDGSSISWRMWTSWTDGAPAAENAYTSSRSQFVPAVRMTKAVGIGGVFLLAYKSTMATSGSAFWI